mgnify:CR=1 FL=1
MLNRLRALVIPPAAAAPRPVAAARPAPQHAAPAPAPTKPAVDPKQQVKTVTQLLKWAFEAHEMEEAAVLAACGVEDKRGIQNLGLTKAIAAIEAAKQREVDEYIAEHANDGTADEADQAGDVDPDDLLFN